MEKQLRKQTLPPSHLHRRLRCCSTNPKERVCVVQRPEGPRLSAEVRAHSIAFAIDSLRHIYETNWINRKDMYLGWRCGAGRNWDRKLTGAGTGRGANC